MSQKKATIAVDERDSSFPLLLSFPQGLPPNYEDMRIVAGQKKPGSKSAKTQVASVTAGIPYRGTDFGESSRRKDCCKYGVGIYDSDAKKITIVPEDHIFAMRPNFDHLIVQPDRISTMDNEERRESLTGEFGSRKKKRALAALKSNRISTENIAGAKTVENLLRSPPPSSQPSAKKSRNK